MKRLLLAGISFAALVAGPATAADLARPVYRAPVVYAPVASWTGFYVGGNVGYAWATDDYTLTTPQLFTGAFPPINAAPGAAGTGSLTPRGETGGFQAGYNYQIQRLVVGAEVDFDALALHNTSTLATIFPPGFGNVFSGLPLTSSSTMRTDWLVTARARVGYTPWDRLLVYVTGGAAWTQVHYSETNTYSFTGGVDVETGSITQTRGAWTIGGGAEFVLFGQWTAKAEYLYANFGTVTTQAFIPAIGFAPSAGAPFIHTADLKTNIVRVGLNYRFPSYAAAPAVYK
jgi:outer membrane immunogenic protein